MDKRCGEWIEDGGTVTYPPPTQRQLADHYRDKSIYSNAKTRNGASPRIPTPIQCAIRLPEKPIS